VKVQVGDRVTYKHDGYEVHARVLRIKEDRILVESGEDFREWIYANDVYFQRGECVVDDDGNVQKVTMVDTDGDLRVGNEFVYRTHVRKTKANA